MADNTQKLNDMDDELDHLDDIDAEADVVDDSWDEFDDEKGSAPLKAKKEKPAKKKSGAGKFLGLIVVLGAAAGGGWYAMNAGLIPGLSPAGLPAADSSATGSEIVELSGDAAPPMPAPIDSAMDTTAIEGTPADALPPGNAAPTDELTPLPGSQDLAQTELTDLDAPTDATSPIPMKAEEGTLEAPPEVPAETPPIETPAEMNAAADITTPEAPALEAAPAEDTSLTAADSQIVPVEEAPAPAETAPVADFSAERNELQSKLETANSEIATLKAQIDALESKLADAESKPAAEEPAETPVAKKEAPAPILRDAPKSTAATKAPAELPPARIVQSTKWQLRSAQPGRAMLSPQGSNEMRSVAVGDSVTGLGKITSINIENGNWIVRGTKGFVSR